MEWSWVLTGEETFAKVAERLEAEGWEIVSAQAVGNCPPPVNFLIIIKRARGQHAF
jgi:hypothetical protein